METETVPYVPADPLLLKRLEKAFAQQWRLYNDDLRAVQEFSVLDDDEELKAAHADMFDDPTGDEHEQQERHTPEEMEFFQREIDSLWQIARAKIKTARTAQEQVTALDDMLRQSFRGACYTGTSSLMPRFFDNMINDVSAKYDEPEPKVAEGAQANVVRLGPSQKQFLEDKLGLLCEYTDMTIDALVDIENLTEAYEAAHWCVGEDAALNPHDVVFKRYCKARQIEDPDAVGFIPEEEDDEFIAREKRFYLDELFAPFNDVMPEKVGLEMAWFMGSAVEAIRHQERERTQNPVLDRFMHQQAVNSDTFVANDNEPKEGFVATEKARRAPPVKRRERSMIEIMNDPEAMERMHAMLEVTFDDFPDAALSAENLADAKHAFTNMFLDGEYAAREAEGPGR